MKALLISNCVSPYSNSINLPNLDELSFLMVFALPNAYKMSLQPKILSYIPTNLVSFFIKYIVLGGTSLDNVLSFSICPIFFPKEAKYFKQYLVFSVFPAPDSPLMTMD